MLLWSNWSLPLQFTGPYDTYTKFLNNENGFRINFRDGFYLEQPDLNREPEYMIYCYRYLHHTQVLVINELYTPPRLYTW